MSQTNSTEGTATTQTAEPGELSFPEYVAMRRGETPKAQVETQKSAPEAKSSDEKDSESDTDEAKAKEESDESEDSETAAGEEFKEAEDGKPKKKGGYQRRIGKLTAEKSAAQREAEYWKAEALKHAGGSKKETVETKPAVADGKPSPDTFDTHAEYVEALTDWKTEQKFKEREQKLEQSKLESEREKVSKAHFERVKSFSEKTDDFEEVMESVNDIDFPPVFSQVILESEVGPQLMYELAKNRDEALRIRELPPIAAARELGKIEARISSKAAATKPETKQVTSAPKPIAPIGSNSSASRKSLDDPSLSFSDYVRMRREQEKRKRSG